MVRRRTQASVRSLRKLGYGAVSNHESPHPWRRGPKAAPQGEGNPCPCMLLGHLTHVSIIIRARHLGEDGLVDGCTDVGFKLGDVLPDLFIGQSALKRVLQLLHFSLVVAYIRSPVVVPSELAH